MQQQSWLKLVCCTNLEAPSQVATFFLLTHLLMYMDGKLPVLGNWYLQQVISNHSDIVPFPTSIASVRCAAELPSLVVDRHAGLVPDLMPAVLSLLRSKAREVIKAVLGMLKVASCCRVPVITSSGFCAACALSCASQPPDCLVSDSSPAN